MELQKKKKKIKFDSFFKSLFGMLHSGNKLALESFQLLDVSLFDRFS